MTSSVSQMKREEGLLMLVCLVAAGGLFAFIAYNLFAAGSIISTDGLFFTVVPLFLALCFLSVPAMQIAAKKFGKTGEKVVIPSKHVSSAMPRPTYAPALKDARGRELPPDVSRMVAQMKAPPAKEV